MKSKNNNRGFGLLFFIVFALMGIWPLKNSGNINLYFITIATIFLVLGGLDSSFLTPLKKVWIKFGDLLGKIIAPLVMSLVYFFILTPISLIVRIFGKDLLNMRFSKNKSYWITRKKDLGPMDKQF